MSDMTAIVVPARLASERFPEKLLHRVRGVPLLLWTARRIREVAPQFPLYFAVDDERLVEVLAGEGFEAILTDPNHRSGTDRLAEANAQIQASAIINVQGDEPLVAVEHIQALARLLGTGARMATLGTPFETVEDFCNPNQVKVVVGQSGKALYFSRAPIPFERGAGAFPPKAVPSGAYRHLGLYGYDAETLRQFVALGPSPLEGLERLEQLRALENQIEIAVGITEIPSVGIDTLEDVAVFEAALDAPESH